MTPEKIGRYEIKAELGKGGMAKVYRAYDPRFDREVAIKVLPRDFLDEPTFHGRFEREAKTIAALEHPAIVPVHDYGEDNGQPYLVMRLMTGGSLADRLESGSLPLREVGRIVGRLSSALDEAHKQGVIHRDLKPGNILFDQYGEAYLADFGIVRLAEAQSSLTETGGSLGTPGYMSPEQIQGDEIDSRSDIYALGVIVFEMLTGRSPFAADSPAMVIVKQMTEPVPSARELNPTVPQEYDTVLGRTMAKKRDERPATASEVADMIASAAQLSQQVTDVLTQASKTMDHDQTDGESAWYRRLPLWGWLVAGGVVISLVVVMAFLFRNQITSVQATSTPLVASQVADTAVPTGVPPTSVTPTAVPPTNTPEPALPDTVDIQAHLDAGYGYLEAGEYEAAIAEANEILVLVPAEARAYQLRGFAHRYAGDLDASIADFGRAIELDPENPNYYIDRSLDLDSIGEHTAALADAAQCVAIAPEEAGCYSRRGRSYIYLRNFEAALADYNKAIELDPFQPYAHTERGFVYREFGDLEAAVTDHTEAIRLAPDDFHFYIDRAYTYSLMGNYEAALADAEQCVLIAPQTADCYYFRADVNRNLLNIEAAVSDFATYLEMAPAGECPECVAEAQNYLALHETAVVDIPYPETVPLAQLAPEIPWLPVDVDQIPAVYSYFFNVHTPPFDDPLVRRALAMAIDREAIAAVAGNVGYRQVQPATTFIHRDTLGRDLYAVVGLEFDLAQAQVLLAQAGYADGIGFPTITLVTNPATGDEAHEAIARALAAMWQENLGIEVIVEITDGSFGDYVNRLVSDTPGLFRMGYNVSDGNDPSNPINLLFYSTAEFNPSQLASDELDALLDEAMTQADDPAARQMLYIQAEELLVEGEAAVIPLFHYYQEQ